MRKIIPALIGPLFGKYESSNGEVELETISHAPVHRSCKASRSLWEKLISPAKLTDFHAAPLQDWFQINLLKPKVFLHNAEGWEMSVLCTRLEKELAWIINDGLKISNAEGSRQSVSMAGTAISKYLITDNVDVVMHIVIVR
ncbi:hypothetical protein V6N12_013918 [Hibiscus sabdariffa]|uniref:Uncharacterized protein n=1 Tax=Hibiscus sabdariffa TaxID=183260 RepID=A0ABR2B0Z9_9ROSI